MAMDKKNKKEISNMGASLYKLIHKGTFSREQILKHSLIKANKMFVQKLIEQDFENN